MVLLDVVAVLPGAADALSSGIVGSTRPAGSGIDMSLYILDITSEATPASCNTLKTASLSVGLPAFFQAEFNLSAVIFVVRFFPKFLTVSRIPSTTNDFNTTPDGS